MSRSGYLDGMENWDLIRWRGAVASAIRGKRGQTLLREMEFALLALPEKRLTSYEIANSKTGEVCALGAVCLKRRLDTGTERGEALKEIEEKFPEGSEAEKMVSEFNVAEALLKEITFINDDDFRHSTAEDRYEGMLAWVRQQILPSKSSG